MRKLIIFASLFGLLVCLTVPATATAAVDYGDYGDQYEKMLSGIPDDIAELLPEGLFSGDPEQLHAAAEQMSGFDYVLGCVGRLTGVRIGAALRLFATLLGLLILSALLRSLKGLTKSPSLGTATGICTTAAMLGALVATQYDQLRAVTTFLDRLNIMADSMIPLMGAMYAMGGNVASAAVNNAAMVFFMTICENVCSRTVVPVAVVCIALALASALSPTVDMRGIASTVKKCFTFVISFIMMLMMAVLSAQSTLAAASDSLGARTAKFMAGNFIPVVGGALGESLRTVAASVKYIRASVGIVGIVIILLLLLPTLISVLLTRLSLMAAGTAARLLGCGEEAGVLGELVGVYGYLLAVISACSVMFIFALTLLSRTSAAWVA